MKKILLTFILFCLVGCGNDLSNNPSNENISSKEIDKYDIQYEVFDNDFEVVANQIDLNIREKLNQLSYIISDNDGIWVEAVNENEVYISVCDKSQYVCYNTKAIYKYDISTNEFSLLKNFEDMCRVFDIAKIGDEYIYSIYQPETSMNQIVYKDNVLCECPASYLECSRFNQYDYYISFLQSMHDDSLHQYSVTYYQVSENDIQSKLIFEADTTQDTYEYLYNNDLYTNGKMDMFLTIQSGPANLYIIDQMNIEKVNLSQCEILKNNITCSAIGNNFIIDKVVYNIDSKTFGETNLIDKTYRAVTLDDQYFLYNNNSNVTKVGYLNDGILKTKALGINAGTNPKFIYKINEQEALIAVDDVKEYVKLYYVKIG